MGDRPGVIRVAAHRVRRKLTLAPFTRMSIHPWPVLGSIRNKFGPEANNLRAHPIPLFQFFFRRDPSLGSFGTVLASPRGERSPKGAIAWVSIATEELNMANAIDFHLGRRLRRRRRLLGLTQQELAASVGVRFQQIQKYECGANRISASRLYELSRALSVPVQYFYDGLDPDGDLRTVSTEEADILSQKETMELVRAYYRLG